MRVLPVMLLALALLAPLGAWADDLAVDRWDKFTLDDQLTRKGKPTWLWPEPEANTSVQAHGLPTDLSPYETLSFWMHLDKPYESRVTLIFHSENAETEGMDYYQTHIDTSWTGWRLFQMPLKNLSVSREPMGWDQVSRAFWSSNWARKLDPATTIHFQDFRLSTEPMFGTAEVAGELFPNRSMEADMNGDGIPDGWGYNPFKTSSQGTLDSEAAHSGNRSFCIDNGDDAKARGGLTATYKPDETKPGTKYVLSAWVKTEGTSSNKMNTSARITTVDADKKVIESDYRTCGPGPFDWKRFEWEVTLPDNTHYFNVILFHHGEGKAWWDDVSMKEAGK